MEYDFLERNWVGGDSRMKKLGSTARPRKKVGEPKEMSLLHGDFPL